MAAALHSLQSRASLNWQNHKVGITAAAVLATASAVVAAVVPQFLILGIVFAAAFGSFAIYKIMKPVTQPPVLNTPDALPVISNASIPRTREATGSISRTNATSVIEQPDISIPSSFDVMRRTYPEIRFKFREIANLHGSLRESIIESDFRWLVKRAINDAINENLVPLQTLLAHEISIPPDIRDTAIRDARWEGKAEIANYLRTL